MCCEFKYALSSPRGGSGENFSLLRILHNQPAHYKRFKLVKLCKSGEICNMPPRCSEQNLVLEKFHTWEADARTVRELLQPTSSHDANMRDHFRRKLN